MAYFRKRYSLMLLARSLSDPLERRIHKQRAELALRLSLKHDMTVLVLSDPPGGKSS